MKTNFTWEEYLKAKKKTKVQIKKMSETEYFQHIYLMVDFPFAAPLSQAQISGRYDEVNYINLKKLKVLERIRNKRYN